MLPKDTFLQNRISWFLLSKHVTPVQCCISVQGCFPVEFCTTLTDKHTWMSGDSPVATTSRRRHPDEWEPSPTYCWSYANCVRGWRVTVVKRKLKLPCERFTHNWLKTQNKPWHLSSDHINTEHCCLRPGWCDARCLRSEHVAASVRCCVTSLSFPTTETVSLWQQGAWIRASFHKQKET